MRKTRTNTDKECSLSNNFDLSVLSSSEAAKVLEEIIRVNEERGLLKKGEYCSAVNEGGLHKLILYVNKSEAVAFVNRISETSSDYFFQVVVGVFRAKVQMTALLA
jgi:prophage antirepressor-like protein